MEKELPAALICEAVTAPSTKGIWAIVITFVAVLVQLVAANVSLLATFAAFVNNKEIQSPPGAQDWVLVPLAAVTKVVGVPVSACDPFEDDDEDLPSPQPTNKVKEPKSTKQ
jgi:hypothetical protein